ncbi:ABC transporter ATP-binding protein [Plastoroseomonas hellenica]|uniref:ABC transporter ATP-binding protein n=1 Tax=Plastoroseomonas hellenica TaxID=2687306 RepID=UPI001BA8E9FC|nr:ABC transporter ATP-binding protein [Plastoroseomonas hellenica]MBR0643577.1 ABC transporter ATP-binding protein [Plastoroseomonas hellenica]
MQREAGREILIEGIEKTFGATRVLKGVSIALREGEFLSLVGPSGCGKTTLLRIIAGLETADAGRITIGGRDVTRLRAADRDIAMVFQNYALYPHLTVEQNLAVPLVMRRLSALERLPLLRHLVPGQAGRRGAIATRVREAAEMLRLGHLMQRRPAQLSGGQRQRVALGRALVREPSAFLMDEPLSNLDAELRAGTRREIVELHRRAGVTTIYVTHDQVEAMTMSDRVAVMMEGELLQLGTPRQVYDDPCDLSVAGFLGSPRINTLPALATPSGVAVGPLVLPMLAEAPAGTTLTLGLRPEALSLTRDGLAATVEHLEFLGAEVLLHARLAAPDAPLVAKLPVAIAGGLRRGDAIRLGAEWPEALLFGADGKRLRTVPADQRIHA